MTKFTVSFEINEPQNAPPPSGDTLALLVLHALHSVDRLNIQHLETKMIMNPDGLDLKFIADGYAVNDQSSVIGQWTTT